MFLIQDLFGLFGVIIYNFDGFIIPFLVKRKMNEIQKKDFKRKFFNYFFLVFFVVGGLTGFTNEIYEKIAGKS